MSNVLKIVLLLCLSCQLAFAGHYNNERDQRTKLLLKCIDKLLAQKNLDIDLAIKKSERISKMALKVIKTNKEIKQKIIAKVNKNNSAQINNLDQIIFEFEDSLKLQNHDRLRAEVANAGGIKKYLEMVRTDLRAGDLPPDELYGSLIFLFISTLSVAGAIALISTGIIGLVVTGWIIVVPFSLIGLGSIFILFS